MKELTRLPSPEWMESASCACVDPDLFFPERGYTAHAARRICAACPVQQECIEYALAFHMDEGIWGGYTNRERDGLRRMRRSVA